MSVRKIVTLPSGEKKPLDELDITQVSVCDGCGRLDDTERPRFIPVRITIGLPSDSQGDGCTDHPAHLCGAANCPLSDMARRFGALWPLPEVAVGP